MCGLLAAAANLHTIKNAEKLQNREPEKTGDILPQYKFFHEELRRINQIHGSDNNYIRGQRFRHQEFRNCNPSGKLVWSLKFIERS
ncbi:hypothetical protein AVEN_62977-1 [Araneus ventricosus]|uniref:Uncharacterized protein n=1 Tax=Araneus ventricosus TaxID=182803 RepID=A0A4Y2CSD4_ARAVE|nr:hypothetical protein AVEN_62977-1 [Araneus ventricosus]